MCMGGLYYCCARLGNGAGRRTDIGGTTTILTRAPVRYEAVLQSYEPVPPPSGGGGYWLVAVRTHGDFIVLPYWNTRPPAP